MRIPASHRNTTAKRYRDYAAENNVMPFLESMVTEMMLAQPDDTIGFMAEFLEEHAKRQPAAGGALEAVRQRQRAAAATAPATEALPAALAPAPAPVLTPAPPTPAAADAARPSTADPAAGRAPPASAAPAAAATTAPASPTPTPAQARPPPLTPGGSVVAAAVGRLDAGDLRVGGEIAEGQFAVVRRALLWGQPVAVKQLKARDDADGATILAELEHEVTILSQLRHPSIVQCIGATDDLDAPWIVMEFLDATLYEAAKSAADAAAVARLLAQVAAACAYLHSRPRPIVHRDLKPPNVLVDGHGRCKLADFGTAAALAGADATLTECIGTALYMAPEVEAAAAYGVASDVFAFGAMAFEVYYYRATGDNFYDDMNLFLGLEVLREPVTADPQQMPSQPDGCDDATWAIVCECLAADAAKRPTAQACAERLRGGEGDAWLARG